MTRQRRNTSIKATFEVQSAFREQCHHYQFACLHVLSKIVIISEISHKILATVGTPTERKLSCPPDLSYTPAKPSKSRTPKPESSNKHSTSQTTIRWLAKKVGETTAECWSVANWHESGRSATITVTVTVPWKVTCDPASAGNRQTPSWWSQCPLHCGTIY